MPGFSGSGEEGSAEDRRGEEADLADACGEWGVGGRERGGLGHEADERLEGVELGGEEGLIERCGGGHRCAPVG